MLVSQSSPGVGGFEPRPSRSDPVGAKNQYAVRFADHMATQIASDLFERLEDISATTKRTAASARGKKQLDINFSTPRLGLALGISLKSVHLRDVKGSERYTHNMKRNEEELRIEASGYHKRQPYAVMVAVLFLPFDAADDGKKDNPSSFGSWVRHLRPYSGREDPKTRSTGSRRSTSGCTNLTEAICASSTCRTRLQRMAGLRRRSVIESSSARSIMRTFAATKQSSSGQKVTRNRSTSKKTSQRKFPKKTTRPEASSAEVRRRMQATRRRDTPGEIALRAALRALGLRYRVDVTLPGTRRRADVAFVRAKVAVFVDGCFWHGCPEHGTWPKANASWWRAKIEANRLRDKDTDLKLRTAGWTVLRFWEHADATVAARRVAKALKG